MTYTEYKELVKEYNSTDSVSRREKIKEEVYKTSVALAKQLEGMYNRFGATFINDDEYRSDRGGFSLVEFSGANVHLRYSDHWQYGGECCFGITVPMKMLDVANRIAERHSLRDKYIVQLKDEHDRNNRQIEHLKEENKNLLNRIAQLEQEKETEG